LFDCPCSDAKTVRIYYAAKTTSFMDLPSIWHRKALPFAKARAMELAAVMEEDPQRAQKYMAMAQTFEKQFTTWIAYLARQINFSQSKLDRTRVRSGWLTQW
jgi:hypothetical protein